MKLKFFFCFALVLGGAWFGCSTAGPHSFSGNHPSGPVTDGLQLELSVSGTDHRSGPEFEVAIRNVGEKDCCLNLGMMLANGKVMMPDKIHLFLADCNGKRQELILAVPAIAGRVDDYVVPLRAGSAYTLAVRLDQFVLPTTGDRPVCAPGRCEVWAQFSGSSGTNGNSDMAGVNLLNFWKGNLRSNPVLIRE